jgi:transposase InsO family protein
MPDIPKFVLYGEADPRIEAAIQPRLTLRKWGELSKEERPHGAIGNNTPIMHMKSGGAASPSP